MKHISDPEHTINKRLHRLYPTEIAERAVNDLIDLIFKYKQRIDSQVYHLSEKDVILISYALLTLIFDPLTLIYNKKDFLVFEVLHSV